MSNFDTIAQFFRSKGYNQTAVDGILGNAQDESNFSPTAYSGQPGTGYGIFQWLGGRWNDLQNFANAHGLDPLSLQAQLEFTWQEIQTNYRSMLPQQLNQSGSPAAAADAWAGGFEGAANWTFGRRENFAAQIAHSGYQAPGGQAYADSGNAGSNFTGFSGGMPNPTAADFQQAEGALGGMLNSIPELRALLKEAVSGGWAVTKFQQAVEQTKWYRSHSDTARETLSLQASDPATFNQNLLNQEANIRLVAGQLGVTEWGPEIQHLALQSLMEGWDSQTLQQRIAKDFLAGERINKGQFAGQAATVQQQLLSTAQDYGVPISGQSVQNWVSSILTGNTPDAFKQYAINTAKSIYRGAAGAINENVTVKDIADPYVQTMANVLEVDPNSINWAKDNTIRSALQGSLNEGAGGPQATTTPIWDFERQLRNDPRWQYTQNARDTTSTALMTLGRDLGKVG